MFTETDQRLIADLRTDIKVKYLFELLRTEINDILDKRDLEQRRREEEKQPLLTIEDVARKFKVTKATVHNWINRGIITGQKMGKNRYFTEDEVRRSLAKYGFTKQWDE